MNPATSIIATIALAGGAAAQVNPGFTGPLPPGKPTCLIRFTYNHVPPSSAHDLDFRGSPEGGSRAEVGVGAFVLANALRAGGEGRSQIAASAEAAAEHGNHYELECFHDHGTVWATTQVRNDQRAEGGVRGRGHARAHLSCAVSSSTGHAYAEAHDLDAQDPGPLAAPPGPGVPGTDPGLPSREDAVTFDYNLFLSRAITREVVTWSNGASLSAAIARGAEPDLGHVQARSEWNVILGTSMHCITHGTRAEFRYRHRFRPDMPRPFSAFEYRNAGFRAAGSAWYELPPGTADTPR